MYQQDGTSFDVNARPHHGLALYVKDFVNVNKVQYFTSTKVEFIVAKLSVGTDCLHFLTIYKAPQFKFHEFCMLLQQKCDHLIDLEKTLVITGDFISDIQKDKQYLHYMQEKFFSKQIVSGRTHDRDPC